MRFPPAGARYSQWDGSQGGRPEADSALAALADDLLEHGDLGWAIRDLLARGAPAADGAQGEGLRRLLKRLREQKRARLDRFDLGGVMHDIEERLRDILARERDTVAKWLARHDDADAAFADDVLRQIAKRNEAELDALPEDTAGRVAALERYEFLDPDAQRDFIALLNRLRKAMAQTFFKDVEAMARQISDGDIARMKAMLRALHDLLVRQIAGEKPDFAGFMARFGDLFGANPPETLEELLRQMREQMAAAQSLLGSMSRDQRAQLLALLADRLDDPELDQALRALTKAMDFLEPRGARYRFGGADALDLEAAMRLMREMHRLDEAIGQVQAAERGSDLDRIDGDLIAELLGRDAADRLDDLRRLMDALTEAGYLRQVGGKWELTPRGSRMIGQRALGEIYARLKRQSLGNHPLPEAGRFGERMEETQPYEHGDAFHLNMTRTIRNAMERDGPALPIRLKAEDFAVHRSERLTSTATAMLVDQSWSMALRGAFQAAKKVALALHHLVTSQYPRDSFHIIGFAAYANVLTPRDLPFLQWDEYLLGTNMQHALMLAEQLLGRDGAGTKQIILISDGEPTAHLLPNGRHQFAYPPTAETWRATFRAVRRCTRKGIAINTFMLDANHHLRQFMDQMARSNGGRVFYSTPDRLGEYILVDYVDNKRKRLGG